MKYYKFNKLVRDKIVDGMIGNNQKPRGVRILDDKEYIKELINKIIEEAQEMKNNDDLEELKKELADIQEVVDYLKKVLKITNSELKVFQKEKIKKAGGFKKRLFVGDVGVEDDNKWSDYYKANPEKYPEL